MAWLGQLSAGVLILFFALEFVVNYLALRAASNSLPGFTFANKKAMRTAAVVYSVLHILGGFFLAKVLNLGIFSGAGLVIGYFVDVGLLWVTDKALKEFEIKETEALFTGAFLMIFCWSVLWFLIVLVLGMTETIDLRPIVTI
jgi:hypothetical protein